MQTHGRSLASLSWSEGTLLKGNSVLMPVLNKERADFLYFHAKRRFKKWVVYANRKKRMLEFRNGAIFQVLTSAEIGKQSRGTITVGGSSMAGRPIDRFTREEMKKLSPIILDEITKVDNVIK